MPAARSKTVPKTTCAYRPRVYLAGPEVFLKQARDIAACKRRLCAAYGMEGIFPLDNAGTLGCKRSPALIARAISAANEAMIRDCDLLIANCTPFRGVSMDAGTAYEIGYARALGKPVFGYTNVLGSYKHRAAGYRRLGDPLNADVGGSAIEDFGLADNLMISLAAVGRDLVRTRVTRGRQFVDTAGFVRCLELGRRLVSAACRPRHEARREARRGARQGAHKRTRRQRP